MPELVYILCAITSVGCAAMLYRAYRATRARLLGWSTMAFIGFAVNNVLLLVDLTVMPQTDLSLLRHLTALLAITVLVVGLIQESR